MRTATIPSKNITPTSLDILYYIIVIINRCYCSAIFSAVDEKLYKRDFPLSRIDKHSIIIMIILCRLKICVFPEQKQGLAALYTYSLRGNVLVV